MNHSALQRLNTVIHGVFWVSMLFCEYLTRELRNTVYMTPNEDNTDEKSSGSTPDKTQGGLSQPATSSDKKSSSREVAKSGENSVTSVFTREHVKEVGMDIILMFSAMGVAFGATGGLVLSQLGEEQLLLLGGVIVPVTVSLMLFTPTILSAPLAIWAEKSVPEQGTDAYLAVGGSMFVGGVVFMVIATLLLGIQVDTGLDIQSMAIPFAVASAPAAVSASATTWIIE